MSTTSPPNGTTPRPARALPQPCCLQLAARPHNFDWWSSPSCWLSSWLLSGGRYPRGDLGRRCDGVLIRQVIWPLNPPPVSHGGPGSPLDLQQPNRALSHLDRRCRIALVKHVIMVRGCNTHTCPCACMRSVSVTASHPVTSSRPDRPGEAFKHADRTCDLWNSKPILVVARMATSVER